MRLKHPGKSESHRHRRPSPLIGVGDGHARRVDEGIGEPPACVPTVVDIAVPASDAVGERVGARAGGLELRDDGAPEG